MVVVPAQSSDARVSSMLLSRPIATLVIDRQPLFLAALGSLLAAPPLSARVLTCPRSDLGLELVRGGGVDLVFCEVEADPIAGADLVRVLAEELPEIPVILLGDQNDERKLTAAMLSSAAGLFTKDAGLDEFLVGVRAVLSGHRAIGAGLMGTVLARLAQQPAVVGRHAGTPLSPTELEILTMIGDAQSIPTIAARRGISHKTVRNHLAKIYRKLDLHGRTEAMLWAARAGLNGS